VDGGGKRVHLLQVGMLAQAQGLALDDEVPALLLGLGAQLLVTDHALVALGAFERGELALELGQSARRDSIRGTGGHGCSV